MEDYRRAPFITEDIAHAKEKHIYVDDRQKLDYAVKILLRYFIIGLDVKTLSKTSKIVTFLVFATSHELILLNLQSIRDSAFFTPKDWIPLRHLLGDTKVTKIVAGAQKKRQLIKDALGGLFYLQGLTDILEAFRALELTNNSLTAPRDAPLEGLRPLDKMCYNLLGRQILPPEMMESHIHGSDFLNIVAEAFLVFHAYIQLKERVRPDDLQPMLQELLQEPGEGEYLTLSVSWSSVYFVDTIDLYTEACDYLNRCKILGFDAEWKPVPSGQGRIALLQIASADKVFLIDTHVLQGQLAAGDWELLKSVFTNPSIIKLGFGVRDDFKLLSDIMGPMEQAGIKDMHLIMRALEKHRPETMVPAGRVFPVVRGLSRLCNILLGRPLNKSKRLSMTNWEKRPLARPFLEYAALDAHCLVLCWEELTHRLGSQVEDFITISVLAYESRL